LFLPSLALEIPLMCCALTPMLLPRAAPVAFPATLSRVAALVMG
jgi:hypothetical protein